jgi:hypothetical protein
MSMIDRAQIASWEALVASKRRRLTDVASGATVRSPSEAEDIRSEVERLESLIAFYKTSAAAAA